MVRRTPATEDDLVVRRALAVDDHMWMLAERLTAALANRVVLEALSSIARRRKGRPRRGVMGPLRAAAGRSLTRNSPPQVGS